MTRQEYLSIFEKHLRVGGERRPDVLQEIASHFDEGAVSTFGDPIRLAKRMNRLHVGLAWPWWSPLAAAGGWLATYFILCGAYAAAGGTYDSISVNNLHAALWLLREIWSFAVPIVLGIYFGRVIARLHRPKAYFLALMAGTLLATYFSVAVMTLITSPETSLSMAVFGSMMITLMATQWIMLIFALSFILLLPHPPRGHKPNRLDFITHTSMYVFSLLLGFLVVNMLSVFLFQPFDGWLTEMRPAHGSFLLGINNFFERGPGTPVLLILYVTGVTCLLIRRIRFQRQRASAG